LFGAFYKRFGRWYGSVVVGRLGNGFHLDAVPAWAGTSTRIWVVLVRPFAGVEEISSLSLQFSTAFSAFKGEGN